MKNINQIKIFTLASYLLIIMPYEHIGPFLFMFIPFLFLNYLTETLSFGKNFIVDFLNLLLIILLIFSFINIFNAKKKWVCLSLLIQYVFLIYMFKSANLNYWYYYVPIIIHFALSLTLIIKLFVLKSKDKN